MGGGLNLALDLLSGADKNAIREIVLVSDGMPNSPQEALEAGERARKQGVNLCLLGVGHSDVDESFLKDISSNYLVIESAEGISQAIAGFLTQAAPPPVSQAGITWLGGKI
jgi:Mg-chelatase subunit ChlD